MIRRPVPTVSAAVDIQDHIHNGVPRLIAERASFEFRDDFAQDLADFRMNRRPWFDCFLHVSLPVPVTQVKGEDVFFACPAIGENAAAEQIRPEKLIAHPRPAHPVQHIQHRRKSGRIVPPAQDPTDALDLPFVFSSGHDSRLLSGEDFEQAEKARLPGCQHS